MNLQGVEGDVEFVPLVNGGYTRVDRDVLPLIRGTAWRSRRAGRHLYAVAAIQGESLYLHRVLLSLSKGDPRFVDHIDNDGLNNTRINLRVCTPAQNSRNRRATLGRAGYKGVFRHRGRYVARIAKDYLGLFSSPHIAAVSYNIAAAKKFGSFASLNVVDLSALEADISAEVETHKLKTKRLLALLAFAKEDSK